jgi:flagellar motor switch protein FliG
MPLHGGPKEAAKLLQAMDSESRLKVLQEMEKQNPRMVELIRAYLVSFDDLRFLTQSMMRDLMRKIDLEKFALALRGSRPELIQHILNLVSVNNRQDMEAILHGKPRSVNDVQKAQDEILQIIIPLVEKGEWTLSEDGDKLV